MPRQNLIRCPKCDRLAWNPDIVVRTGKNPEKKYTYYRYRHPLDRRTGRNKTCYVPIPNPGQKPLESTQPNK